MQGRVTGKKVSFKEEVKKKNTCRVNGTVGLKNCTHLKCTLQLSVFRAAFYNKRLKDSFQKRRNSPNRQQKPGKVSLFSLFIQKSNFFFHCGFFLTPYKWWALEDSNAQRPEL